MNGPQEKNEVDPVAAPPASRSLHSKLEHEPLMAKLLKTYIADLPLLVSELQQLVESNDLIGLRLAAHHLRGSGGGYGFPQISTAAGQLEDCIKSKSPESELQTLADELTELLRCVPGYGAKGVEA